MNYAELQRQIDETPTVETARRLGSTHSAYGWLPTFPHTWPQVLKNAYIASYRKETRKS